LWRTWGYDPLGKPLFYPLYFSSSFFPFKTNFTLIYSTISLSREICSYPHDIWKVKLQPPPFNAKTPGNFFLPPETPNFHPEKFFSDFHKTKGKQWKS
jgi:hypothetical protein